MKDKFNLKDKLFTTVSDVVENRILVSHFLCHENKIIPIPIFTNFIKGTKEVEYTPIALDPYGEVYTIGIYYNTTYPEVTVTRLTKDMYRISDNNSLDKDMIFTIFENSSIEPDGSVKVTLPKLGISYVKGLIKK